MIYHLTESARWQRSLAEGEHTGSTRGIDLADEGFIHCSTAEQWPGVRERFYADVADLLLLHVDEARLPAALVYERLGDATEPFPHVYGPIPLHAIVAVEPLPRLRDTSGGSTSAPTAASGTGPMAFNSASLDLDLDHEIGSITNAIQSLVHHTVRRKGAVVAISGGIDSAACAALCVKALGPSNVLLLGLPEAASSPESLELARELAGALGAEMVVDDITAALQGAGCYDRQLEAIRQVFPEYGPGWKHKLSIPSILESDRLNITRLVVEDPDGRQQTKRMPTPAYLQLVAATNFKQRTRTTMTYYHADRLHYAVCGTPNRLEYDQGFFVKGGDGLADFKPIAHLYKTQVFAVAAALGVPAGILGRTPTTDTFTLAQTQEDFYFALPYHQMDLCLYAHNHGVSVEDAAPVVGITPEQMARVYADIEAKRRATDSLHRHGLLVAPVPEIG